MTSQDIPETDINLNIFRVHDGLDRYVKDAKTEETLYYCEATTESQLTIHHRAKDGPLVATGVACLLTPGGTDVHMADLKSNLHMDHVYHKHSTSKSEFVYNDRRLHWHGENQLFDDERGHMLAQFHPMTKSLSHGDHLLGTLVIKPAGKYLVDLAVVTALVMQERSPEGRHTMRNARIRAKDTENNNE